jgi:AraC-like DNA-binding protein
MTKKFLKYNDVVLFSYDRDFIGDNNSNLESKARIFIYDLNNWPHLSFDTIGKKNENDHIYIKIKDQSNQVVSAGYLREKSLVVCLNSKLLKLACGNSQPPLLSTKNVNNKEHTNSAIKKLLLNYYCGVQELMNLQSQISEDILLLKIKELLILLSYSNGFNHIAKSIQSLRQEDTIQFETLIEDNLYKAGSIQDLANSSNMSLSKFKRKFREIYDTTPNRYLINRRIEKVAHLLKYSNDTISTIGYDCGFVAPAHLTRVFKAKYHKTPSEYRLQYLN